MKLFAAIKERESLPPDKSQQNAMIAGRRLDWRVGSSSNSRFQPALLLLVNREKRGKSDGSVV